AMWFPCSRASSCARESRRSCSPATPATTRRERNQAGREVFIEPVKRGVSALVAPLAFLCATGAVAAAATQIGTDGPDRLSGTVGPDQLYGEAGDDELL